MPLSKVLLGIRDSLRVNGGEADLKSGIRLIERDLSISFECSTCVHWLTHTQSVLIRLTPAVISMYNTKFPIMLAGSDSVQGMPRQH